MRIKDAKNNTTSYTYEANTDRVTKVESGLSTVTYEYSQDRLSEIRTNGNQVRYKFGYDELGRNTQVSVGAGSGTGSYTLSTNTYNDRSLLTKQQYGNGQSVHYAYDNLDRVKGKGYNGSASAYQYGYDAQGRLSVMKDTVNNRYTRLTYDLAGRLAESETRSGLNSNTVLKTWLGYTYENKTNRLSKLTYQTPKHGSTSTYRNAPFEITYGTGSNRDRVMILGHNGAYRVQYAYDALGRVFYKDYPTTLSSTPRNTSYTYADGSETYMTTSLVASISNSGLGTLSYTYDANGNIASISQDGVLQESYTYDGLNQLKSVTRGGVTTSYTYDAGGNILSRTTGSSTVAYGYGDAQWKDKLTSWNGQAITYDGIGNPLQYRDGISLTWKNGRQLSTMTKSGTSASYTYDEDGNRLSKTANGLTTTYYWAGGQALGQYRSDGKDVGYFLDGNGGVYGIYYDDVTKPGGARTYYFIYNAQGDVIGLYNFNGTLVATYSYDEWGKCTVNALIPDDAGNPTTSGNHVAYFNQFRYRGYMFDDETGFYYLGSRYYDPTTGRFINADTSLGANGDILSYNLFTYCSNNPIRYSDPTGTVVLVDDILVGIICLCIISCGAIVTIDATAPSRENSAFKIPPLAIPSIRLPSIEFDKPSKKSGKEKSSDKPSWVNKGMVDPNKSAEENARQILNKKYGPGNWGKGPGSEFNIIKKWLVRGLGLKSIAGLFDENDDHVVIDPFGNIIVLDAYGAGFGWVNGKYYDEYNNYLIW